MSALDTWLPDRPKNVGGLDRVARAAVGVVLLLVAAWAAWAGRGVLSVVAVVGAVGLLFNAATQFCGVNAALGIDTCQDADGKC